MTPTSFVLFLLYLNFLSLSPRLHQVRLEGQEKRRKRQREAEAKRDKEKTLCVAGASLHLTLEQRRGFGWKQEVIAILE